MWHRIFAVAKTCVVQWQKIFETLKTFEIFYATVVFFCSLGELLIGKLAFVIGKPSLSYCFLRHRLLFCFFQFFQTFFFLCLAQISVASATEDVKRKMLI